MIRRATQVVSLVGFAALLTWAILGAADTTVFEWVLGMDPALSGITAIGAHVVLWAFLPAAVLAVLGLAVGRGFCGYVCPMGTLVDAIDGLMRRIGVRRPRRSFQNARDTKFLVLGFLIGAAVLGVSLVYVASPFSLMTRLLGLLVYPAAVALADAGLWAARPLAAMADLHAITFAKVEAPVFDTTLFLLVFLGALAGAAAIAPRFWCRHVCPAGAVLAATSFRPVLRRRVSDACGGCGDCAEVCPMGAIDLSDFRRTHHEDCILCKSCQTVCSLAEVSFLPELDAKGSVPALLGPDLSQARRRFVIGGLAGAGTAAFSLAGLALPMARAAAGGGENGTDFLRPPGAVPEDEFLARCVRCAACAAVCPQNALQPLYAGTGITALFSPGLVPESGPCDPDCARCGEVCPTGAIRELAGEERLWAKTGTAAIDIETCIAWKDGEKCMVCDEVCPFDAVVFGQEPGIPVAVPHVEAARCAGCGYCENACPVEAVASIQVFATDALRLSKGSYIAEGQARGLAIALDTEPRGMEGYPAVPGTDGGPAPGFDSGDIAPGFNP